MKKVIIAAAFASFATFGFTGIASAYDLGASCSESVSAQPLPAGVTADQMQAGCTCLVDSVGGDPAIVGSFEAAGDDQSLWSPEAVAAVASCFPAAE